MDPRALLFAFAPLASEEDRRAFLVAHLAERGLGPRVDAAGNVLAGEGPVWLLAHYDTVLPPTPIRERNGRWYTPAVGDNSSGVAVTLALAGWEGLGVAFTVGEEGLGNLKGARAFFAEHRPRWAVAVDGYLGTLVPWAVGSVRLEARFLGPGGHAWGDRGRPSSSHALGLALAALYALPLPPEAGLNAGRVWGGGAINAIPAEAGLWLDLRARTPEVLEALYREARAALAEAAARAGVEVRIRLLGRRPAGATAPAPLAEAAEAAVREVGLRPEVRAASTDAAAAIEAGVPAIAVGAYRGGGAHTPDEWVEPDSLVTGVRLLAALLGRLP